MERGKGIEATAQNSPQTLFLLHNHNVTVTPYSTQARENKERMSALMFNPHVPYFVYLICLSSCSNCSDAFG